MDLIHKVSFLVIVFLSIGHSTLGTKCYNCISRDGSVVDCDDPFTSSEDNRRKFGRECRYGCFKAKITRPLGGYVEVNRKCAEYPAQSSCRSHDVQNAQVDCTCNTDYCNEGLQVTSMYGLLLICVAFSTVKVLEQT